MVRVDAAGRETWYGKWRVGSTQVKRRLGLKPLVFAHPASRKAGTPLDGSKVLKRFKRTLTRAGIREVRFHDLRHTFGTRMPAGVPMRTLQEWMGHRDFATTLVYGDYAPSAHESEWIELAFATATFDPRQRAAESGETAVAPRR